MCLLSIGMTELEEVLKYELSPVPLSLFDSNGEMRHSTSKAKLKNRLQIETSQRLQSKADVVIIDGCGNLWSISWPKNATLRDLAYQLYQHVTFLLATEDMDVFLVFDRYFKYSIEGTTRKKRAGNLANNDVLTLDAPLPSREIVMNSSQNKIQGIDIISKYIVDMLTANHFKNRFVDTCSETTSTQVQEGVVVSRKCSHEEADVNIVKQCISCAVEKTL